MRIFGASLDTFSLTPVSTLRLSGCRHSAVVSFFELDIVVLSHMVYFTLKDPSKAACQKLIDSCQHYLPGHDGIVFFGVGTHTPDLNRPVNDSDFHVTANVVFATREDHDAYQTSEKHLAFVAENKDSWAQLRVFDADVN